MIMREETPKKVSQTNPNSQFVKHKHELERNFLEINFNARSECERSNEFPKCSTFLIIDMVRFTPATNTPLT